MCAFKIVDVDVGIIVLSALRYMKKHLISNTSRDSTYVRVSVADLNIRQGGG